MSAPLSVYDQRRTEYWLAHEILKVGAWIAAHHLHGEDIREPLDVIDKVASHLRGESNGPIQRIAELIRTDPWAATIAAHVLASVERPSVRAGEGPQTDRLTEDDASFLEELAEDSEILGRLARGVKLRAISLKIFKLQCSTPSPEHP